MFGCAVGDGDVLFTDVEGSTLLWESAPLAMGMAMGRHDELVASLRTALQSPVP
jgi:hypothetical protein